MNIILRNFYRLLRAGVFDEIEQVEPMSAWKWRRVYQYSLIHNVAALAYDGIEKCKEQFFLQMPDDLLYAWKETTEKIESRNTAQRKVTAEIYELLSRQQFRPILIYDERMSMIYNHPNHRCSNKIELFLPYQTQGKKACQWAKDNAQVTDNKNSIDISYSWNGQSIEHRQYLHTLTNKILNHSLQNIIEKEIIENKVYIEVNGRKCEVISNTMTSLVILLRIAHNILNSTIYLNLVIDLGVSLRKIGDKVDFVVLQSWIERLHMTNIAHLSGLLLIKQFNFTEDEIPFLKKDGIGDVEKLTREMFMMKNEEAKEWIEQNENNILMPKINSSAFFSHIRNTARNLNYYPAESLTNLLANITRSLSRIEE